MTTIIIFTIAIGALISVNNHIPSDIKEDIKYMINLLNK